MFNKKFYFAIVSDGKEKRVANWSCWLTCATSLRSLLTHIQSQPTILLPPTKYIALRMIIASILSKKRYKRCIHAEKIAKNTGMSVLIFAM